jgi:hypothetical protein
MHFPFCIIFLAQVSSKVPDRSGKRGHPSFVPDFRTKTSTFSSLSVIKSCSFVDILYPKQQHFPLSDNVFVLI